MSGGGSDIGGSIRVRIRPEAEVITAVEITSTRPHEAARVFEGKPVAELCGSIGRIFSLCGTAQTVAALRASEQALGLDPAPGVEAARDLARLAEMLTQTAMRLALHWPRALGLEMRPDLVRACLDVERNLAEGVLGDDWRAPGAGTPSPRPALSRVLGALDTLLVSADPGVVLAEALNARGLAGYGALPEGTAPEDGAFARNWSAPSVAAAREQSGAGLAARLAASRAELGDLPLQMIALLGEIEVTEPRQPRQRSGQGKATVDTARGPLSHHLRIEDGVVVSCRTEAPTEANFGPDGPVAAGLTGAAADPVAAELHVLAVDPCVACSVEIAEA